MSRTKEQLLAASNQVKNETQQGANTASRIGGILYDISEHIGEGGGGGGDTVDITPTYTGGIKIADVYINSQHKELHAPNGGGGTATVNYSIAVLSTSVAVNNGKVAGEIHFEVLKTVGTNTEEVTSSPFTEGEEIKVSINGDNSLVPRYNNGYFTVSKASTDFNSSYPFSQIYVDKNGTILASTTIPIIENGQSSTQSLDAVVMRFRSYAGIISGGNTEECGDGYGNIQTGTTPYIDGVIYKDIVIFDGDSGDGDYYYVDPEDSATHNKGWATRNPPANNGNVNTFWVRFNDMGDAAFKALLAKYAYIENLTASEIVITDGQMQKPIAGMTRSSASAETIYPTSDDDPLKNINRGSVRIWAGYDSTSGNLLNSKFYVTDAGFLHAENANITGIVIANDGKIGGFSIGQKELTNSDWQAGIDIKVVDANNKGKIAKIGDNAKGDMIISGTTTENAIMRAENTEMGNTYNTALYLNAQNATYNYAFYGNGNGVLNGLMFGYKVNAFDVTGSVDKSYDALDIKDGATVVFTGSRTDGTASVYMPKISDVRKALGITASNVKFAFEYALSNQASGNGTVKLLFRNYPDGNSEYPYRTNFDNNYTGNNHELSMAEGDYVKILLMWEGTTYKAFVIRHIDGDWG